MIKKIKKYKETSIALVFAIVCLLCYIAFPTQGIVQKMSSLIIFFVVFPILFHLIIRKGSIRDLGLSLGKWKKGILFSFISLFFSFLILTILFKTNSFQENYLIPKVFSEKFLLFLVYEFLIVGLYFACFSFFFNGFIMLSFEKDFGKMALFVQFVVFIVFIILTGNLNWMSSLLIINVLFGGLIALKSHSLIYPIISGLLFALIADSLIIKFLYN